MQRLSFKNRIASNYLISTALLIFVVFLVIYAIVRFSVYIKVNNDIKTEVAKHLKEIEVKENCVLLVREEQWKSLQFNKVDVSPAFIQFVDELGALVEKSPNLKKNKLTYYPEIANNTLFDGNLDNISVRQIQVPLYQGTKIIGFLIVAMSLKDTTLVLNNLFTVLILAYPLILIVLFLLARFIAGRSIKPISSIIATSNSDSLGIELVCAALANDPKKPDDLTYETVTDAQNKSLQCLVAELEMTLGIATTEVFRHPTVSRKNASEASTAKW